MEINSEEDMGVMFGLSKLFDPYSNSVRLEGSQALHEEISRLDSTLTAEGFMRLDAPAQSQLLSNLLRTLGETPLLQHTCTLYRHRRKEGREIIEGALHPQPLFFL
jgi:hypothetical protein